MTHESTLLFTPKLSSFIFASTRRSAEQEGQEAWREVST